MQPRWSLGHRPGLRAYKFCPLCIIARHLSHPVRILIGDVVSLRSVLLHVVEFPIIREARYQLPLSLAHGAVTFVLPKERTLRKRVSGKYRCQAFTLQRRRSRARLAGVWISCTRNFKTGRHHVDFMTDRARQAFFPNARRPMREE